MPDPVRFYKLADPYGEFSNFARFPFEMDSKVWPTSEHYFQAKKFVDAEHQDAIRAAKSAMIAARMGRSRKRPLRPDWEAVKIQVMREAVFAKFSQNEELKTLLLGTGDAELIEHTTRDHFWGDGGDGSGKNMLGRILMEVRETLQTNA